MRQATNQQAARHPMTYDRAQEMSGVYRCSYSGGCAGYATRGRSGYWNVHLLEDPGVGSMYITGTAPGNILWVDLPPELEEAPGPDPLRGRS
jgi:hypothetical protein